MSEQEGDQVVYLPVQKSDGGGFFQGAADYIAGKTAMTAFEPTIVSFGTIDILAIILNFLSLLCFPRISRIIDSEIIILMFTLTMLSFASLALFIIKLFDLVQSSMTTMMHLMTMFAPVGFHIIVPAIMMKAAAFLDKSFKPHKMTTYLYGGVCIFCMLHVVMIISPMPAFDHTNYESVHESHDGLHMSMSTPLFMLVGALPQTMSLMLLARLGLVISHKKYAVTSPTEGTTSLSPLALYYKRIGSTVCYKGRNYFVRWSASTFLMVLPSMIVSYGSYLTSFSEGANIHVSMSYLQALCDSLIFFTQPISIIMLWFGVILRNHRVSKSPSVAGLYQVQMSGQQHHVYLDASGTPIPVGGQMYQPSAMPQNTSGVPLQIMPVHHQSSSSFYAVQQRDYSTETTGNGACGGISGSNSVHSDV